MKNLPVSKKVYADITSRISSSLSHAPASEAEAMRLVDSYLRGEAPACDDVMAMLAFSMIRVELDRAISRSERARKRAKARHKERQAESNGHQDECDGQQPDTKELQLSSVLEHEDAEPDTAAPQLPMPKLSRRARRILERLEKGKRKKWGSIM